ncbi:leader peptidase (prepilin peptidase)/N-methyltransferase [Bacillus cereus VDM021]|nr:leader peptidase (prepilin peptidase)/N-methyltransferase [Bacillus cereus VDM006]EOQ14000.1 leader peptidase (prepilin peptidase)/N-methyltransferase [Bacillus cereus VDM021]OOG93372.1 Late competence protein ComC, processing protease [Bacillus mycoides]
MACFFIRTKIMRNGSVALFLLYFLGEGEDGVIFYLYAFLIGTVLGSFYTVVAVRIPIGQSIIAPRSYCDYCRHTLRSKELIPIISFCLQRGRCIHCKMKVPFIYTLFEVITGGAFLFFTYVIGMDKELILIWTLLSLLIIITMTDLFYMLIPDVILFSFACLFVLEHIFISLVPWWEGLIGGGTIFIVLYLVQILFPNGLGGGDVKLLSLLGFIIGAKAIFIVLCCASSLSLCFFGIGMLLKRITSRQPFPFGPFIALGTICYLAMIYLE